MAGLVSVSALTKVKSILIKNINHYLIEDAGMTECDVKLYSLSTCIYCKDTKEFLDQCGIKYKCIEVDKLELEQRRKVLEELKEIKPECAFPTIIIGDQVIVGLQKDEIKEILGIK
jgi:glutaredoxin-like protein NrdH